MLLVRLDDPKIFDKRYEPIRFVHVIPAMNFVSKRCQCQGCERVDIAKPHHPHHAKHGSAQTPLQNVARKKRSRSHHQLWIDVMFNIWLADKAANQWVAFEAVGIFKPMKKTRQKIRTP
jgi:hypothetical protein